MKKIITIICLLLLCTPIICTHTHDESCGYDFSTKSGCRHQCKKINPLDHQNPPI